MVITRIKMGFGLGFRVITRIKMGFWTFFYHSFFRLPKGSSENTFVQEIPGRTIPAELPFHSGGLGLRV